MGRPRRREREIQRVRRDIAEAAARVFARSGYHAATMQDIAAEAGYGAASLYGYFEGKQAILEALAELVREEMFEVFSRPLPEGLSFELRLELLLRDQLAWAERRRDAFLFFLQRAGREQVPVTSSEAETDGMALSVSYLESLIREHATEEDLGSTPAHDAALVLWGITYSYLMQWLRSGHESSLTDLTTTIVDFFFRAVRGTPAVRTANGTPREATS